MTSGAGPHKASVYFGLPVGIYSQDGFRGFVEGDLSCWMNQNEVPNQLNIEKSGRVTTYHFPQAGIGLEYTAFGEDRCGVQMFAGASRRDTMEGIFRLVVRKERDK